MIFRVDRFEISNTDDVNNVRVNERFPDRGIF